MLEVEYYLRRMAVEFSTEHDLYYYDSSYCESCSSETCTCSEEKNIIYKGSSREDGKLVGHFSVLLSLVHGYRSIKHLCEDVDKFR